MPPSDNAIGIAKAVPFGTGLILSLTTVLFLLNLFVDTYNGLCLASTNTTNGIFSHFLTLELNPLVHSGPWHYVVAFVSFATVAGGVEQSIGTFGFLNLLFVATLLNSLSYTLIVWIISWAIPSWGTACIGGLDIPFFSFLTIEGLSRRGIFEVTNRMGIAIPDYLYPIPFLGIYLIILPFSSWMAHILACIMGCLFFFGFMKNLILDSESLLSYESAGIFAFIVKRSNFVPAPGGVQLPPMPGAYTESMM